MFCLLLSIVCTTSDSSVPYMAPTTCTIRSTPLNSYNALEVDFFCLPFFFFGRLLPINPSPVLRMEHLPIARVRKLGDSS